MERQQLIEDLKKITQSLIARAEAYKHLSAEELNGRSQPGKWSVLECLEHLNLYGEFYLPEIEKRLLEHPARAEARQFRPGLLGNYFVGMMQVKNSKVKKMKTFKDKDPIHVELDASTIDRFIKQQKQMLRLLEMAKKKDLTRIKTSISISNWIKLRLGDTLRLVIYHNQRHIWQADRVLALVGVA